MTGAETPVEARTNGLLDALPVVASNQRTSPPTSSPPAPNHAEGVAVEAAAAPQDVDSTSLSELDELSDDENDFYKINGLGGAEPSVPAASPSEAVAVPSGDGEGPPAKKRRVRDRTPDPVTRMTKPISPPWKKIEADGPSSFNEGGRRKSGRINTAPLELQSDKKRITRRGFAAIQHTSPTNTRTRDAQPPEGRRRASSSGNRPARPTSSSANTANKQAAAPSRPPQPNQYSKQSAAKSARPANPQDSPRSRRKSSPSRNRAAPPAAETRRTSRVSRPPTRHLSPRRASRSHADVASTTAIRATPRIRLRVRPVGLPTTHPEHVLRRKPLAPSFSEYFDKAWTEIPVSEGGLMGQEEGETPYTQAMAERDAKLMERIEAECEPGGLLSHPRCSIYAPPPAEEPPQRWAHWDHLVKAMSGFRRLMVMEQQRHRSTAKKLAEACREEWLRRQPKTAEEIEAEQRALRKQVYRNVVKALAGTWDNVKVEVNKTRLAEWEAEEQRRVKAALNEAVNISEQKLQARQAQFEDSGSDGGDDGASVLGTTDSEEEDDDEVEDQAEEDLEDDSDVMSTSADGEDDDTRSLASDEGLTQEQLREKYANIPAADAGPGSMGAEDNGVEPEGGYPDELDSDDMSDESIDMDDDLGSSDEGISEEDGSGSEEDDSGEEQSGLLGMLFGKSELKEMRAQSAVSDDQVPQPSVEKSEEDASRLEVVAHESNHTTPNGHPTPTITNGLNHTASPAVDDYDAVELIKQPASKGSSPKPHNTDQDTPMLDAEPGPNANDAGQKPIPLKAHFQPADVSEQPSSDGEAVTGGSSPRLSPSYPAQTPDTKPSELDTASVDDKSARVGATTRSETPQITAAKTEIPSLLRGTLREYQHYGLDWLAGLYANKTNGILADEMGLGKTIQTIALLAHLACHHGVWGPHLIIVPTSVMLNWEMEFKKWCPGFKILSYYGSIEERRAKRKGWMDPDAWNVCITSYQIVLKDEQTLKKKPWHYMILDEAHNIKNFKSKRWQSLLTFNTQARLLLTGTPLQNNLTELWSLLFFLMPAENGEGGFVDLPEFHEWFRRPESQILESGREEMDDEARAIISKLHRMLRPYLLRRLKMDVEKQMPAKYEHVEICRLSKRQRELYDGFLARSDTRAAFESGNYMSIINCLMQLRKVCNHPDLFVDRPIVTSFTQTKSVPASYVFTERLVRSRLLKEDPMNAVRFDFINLVPTLHEWSPKIDIRRIEGRKISTTFKTLKDAQRVRAQAGSEFGDADHRTVRDGIVYVEAKARWGRFEELQHAEYVNALRRQQSPVYGSKLLELVDCGVSVRPFRPKPTVPRYVMDWFEEDSVQLRGMIKGLGERSWEMSKVVARFGCVTPAAVARDMTPVWLGERNVSVFEEADLRLSAPVKHFPFVPAEKPEDPWHEARMRLSIQFPDKRLLQYDCGKLQVLDKLLRKLQRGGHRALIFTQMTKVLDILEQFLNIHGHKYLRLDGATKIEQRQLLTERFNADERILVFILSTRSGGLGINLTGADSVIFYDQDWNPAMDKQCQDRCHRIGQTRDVHIYRLVSEHTIEGNILRKATQKQMLDDVVIQEGAFTTEWFGKNQGRREVLGENADEGFGRAVRDGEDKAAAAMERILGGGPKPGGGSGDGAGTGVGSGKGVDARVLEQAEDKEDVLASHVAAREMQREMRGDEQDFDETGAKAAAAEPEGDDDADAAATTAAAEDEAAAPAEEAEPEVVEMSAYGERIRNIDDFMLRTMGEMLAGTPLELPKDKNKKGGARRRGRDTRKR